ncbi:MAG: phosphate signaling complex protein PhoU [Candidatus Omnitrophica bacterium]|nr:phosphate signaling complex protein PhoU [Candidatus Omnitrophota bacterium]
MNRQFDSEQIELQGKLLHMAGLAEEAIGNAVRALESRDSALADAVIQNDEAINLSEIEIENQCLRLLALRSPEATDLRFITMIFKINNDLERIGDLAVNIAERSLDLLRSPLLKPLIDIPRMADIAQGMVKDALDAFVRRDADLAVEVCRRDDQVDLINDQLFRELLTYMLQDPTSIERAVGLIFVGRHLERIADHSTNIAEDVVYLVKGKTIKHHTGLG